MKRFTETLKWDDAWFRALPPNAKLIFFYLLDRCDNAGFWEVDNEAIEFHTKLPPLEIQGALMALARGIEGASGFLWVKNFLRHQKNDVLNAENPAHRQIINLLSGQLDRFSESNDFGRFVAPLKGLFSPIGTGIGKGKGKEEGSGEKPKRDRGTIDDIAAFCAEIGIPPSDAEWFFHKCQGNGWTNNGKPIRDWKSTLRSWKSGNFLPSQKNGQTPNRPSSRVAGTTHEGKPNPY